MISAGFRNFLGVLAGVEILPTHAVTHTGKGLERSREEEKSLESRFCPPALVFSHDLCHEAANFFRSVFLHLLRYFGINVQRELRRVMA